MPASPATSPPSRSARLRELAGLFLKLGVIGFGGPAAHIALMESEIVHKRQWVTRQQFLDMLGAANLIPGPTSTEMAINSGFVRAGWAGMTVAGASFILPAAVITGAFAWVYVRFGSLPQVASILAGIKPAILALIVVAIWRLGRTAVKNARLAVLAGAALAAFFLGVNPIAILIGGGLLGMLVGQAFGVRPESIFCVSLLAHIANGKRWNLSSVPFAAVLSGGTAPLMQPSLMRIGLFFLKVGAVLYGGGYVLLAFLDHGLVQQRAWLTHSQLLDAIAIGQFTPGPVLSTATFIGYILAGVPGAAVATVAIFLPSFLYVGLLAPVLFRLRQSAWMAAFLDSVNACAIALMAGVTVQLAVDALRPWPAWIMGAVAIVILLRWKINPAWVVLGGGLTGLLLAAIRYP